MKLLIYNWIPFDETEYKGGGVTVYTKNLIQYFIDHFEWEIYFLSSGRAYTGFHKSAYIESTANIFGKRCKSYQIVNSPVLSAAHVSFPYPDAYLQDRTLKEIVRQFLIDMGGFDVIHFQNLEGLSAGVLELKKEFPGTRFLYSLHNYYPFCPQVMLWQEDCKNCLETECGRCCVACMPVDVHRKKVVLNQTIHYYRKKQGKAPFFFQLLQKPVEQIYKVYDACLGEGRRRKNSRELSEAFYQFRKRNTELLSEYTDGVLAVSKRVSELAVSYGVKKEKIHVSYIGTAIAENQRREQAYSSLGDVLQICYLGYMRTMKGFFFLLEALEELDLEIASRIVVKLAAKVDDPMVLGRLYALRDRFADVILYNGYTHEELPNILEHVNLGIVPPLWEDNLPQVAIELKANGIPVLAGDRGGANELSPSKLFVFRAGDKKDFLQKLSFFVRNPQSLGEYWKDAPPLVTMEQHVDELIKYYTGV